MSKEINYLENWVVLNEYIQTLDEKTIKALIEKEKNNEARPQFLVRLYGRFNKLRGMRERKELLSFKK